MTKLEGIAMTWISWLETRLGIKESEWFDGEGCFYGQVIRLFPNDVEPALEIAIGWIKDTGEQVGPYTDWMGKGLEDKYLKLLLERELKRRKK